MIELYRSIVKCVNSFCIVVLLVGRVPFPLPSDALEIFI